MPNYGQVSLPSICGKKKKFLLHNFSKHVNKNNKVSESFVFNPPPPLLIGEYKFDALVLCTISCRLAITIY